MKTRNKYTKKSLAKRAQITSKRLTKVLKPMEFELKAKFPEYNKNSQILGRRIFRFLLVEVGQLEKEEVEKIMAELLLEDIGTSI